MGHECKNTEVGVGRDAQVEVIPWTMGRGGSTALWNLTVSLFCSGTVNKIIIAEEGVGERNFLLLVVLSSFLNWIKPLLFSAHCGKNLAVY